MLKAGCARLSRYGYEEDSRRPGQEPVKRALLIAAAGSHNVLMVARPAPGNFYNKL